VLPLVVATLAVTQATTTLTKETQEMKANRNFPLSTLSNIEEFF
jgi:hypothetical protein